MGRALSWLAVRGLADIELAEALGLKKTGKQSDRNGGRLLGRSLPSGWYVVVANHADDPITRSSTLKQLSRKCQAIACSIEEHGMFSSCSLWTKGRQAWSVKHRGDRSALDLSQSGRLPAEFASLRARLTEQQRSAGGEQADVDHIFELPLELAKHFVGFKHDDASADGPYEVLEPTRLKKASRAIRALAPWVYTGIILIGVIVLIALANVAARRSIDWLLQLLKRTFA